MELLQEEQGDSQTPTIRRKMSKSHRSLLVRSEEAQSQQPRRPSSGKKSRRRSSMSRETVDAPCPRRLRTGFGAEEVSEHDFFATTAILDKFNALTQDKELEEEGIVMSFLKGMEEGEKIELIQQLYESCREQKTRLEFFRTFTSHSRVEKIRELLQHAGMLLSIEKARLVEIDQNAGISKCILSGKKISDNEVAIHCIETRKSVVLNDLETRLPFPKQTTENASCIISIPLCFQVNSFLKREVTLALQLFNKICRKTGEIDLEGFTKSDQVMAEHLAILVRVIAENYYRKLESKQMRANLRHLADAAGAISSEIDGPNLIENLVKLTARLVPCQLVTLYVFDKTKKELYSVFSTKQVPPETIAVGVGIVGKAAEKKEVQIIRDALEEGDIFSPEKDISDSGNRGNIIHRSLLALPIQSDVHFLGVLLLVNKIACEASDPILPRTDGSVALNASRKLRQQTVAPTPSASTNTPSKFVRSASEHKLKSLDSWRSSNSSLLDNSGDNIFPKGPNHFTQSTSYNAITGSERTINREGSSNMSFRIRPSNSMKSAKREVPAPKPLKRRDSDRFQPFSKQGEGQEDDNLRGFRGRGTESLKIRVNNTRRSSWGNKGPSIVRQFTVFTEYHVRVGSVVCARLGQALRIRMVNYEYDKAIAENEDASDLLRSILYNDVPDKAKETKNQITGYRKSFQAIGKFLRVLKTHRIEQRSISEQIIRNPGMPEDNDNSSISAIDTKRNGTEAKSCASTLVEGDEGLDDEEGRENGNDREHEHGIAMDKKKNTEKEENIEEEQKEETTHGWSQEILEECTEAISQMTHPDGILFAKLAEIHNRLSYSKLDTEFAEWHFDVLEHNPHRLEQLVHGAFLRAGVQSKFRIPEVSLKAFIHEVRNNYIDNPYHNWFHAVSVFQMSYSIIIQTSACSFLHFQDIFALLVAALGHDVGHRGRTNDFESKQMSELALQYNDNSVLEQYHAFLTFSIILRPECNIMAGMSGPKFKEVRKLIISHILNTDMKFHAELISKINALVMQGEKNEECSTIVNRESPDDRDLFCSFLLHCCDIGAQTGPPDAAKKWASLVLSEFSAQSKEEATLGLPLTPYMQNLEDPLTMANVQFGFIAYVVEPAWVTLCSVVPDCSFTLDNLHLNKQHYADMRTKLTQIPAATTKPDNEQLEKQRQDEEQKAAE